MRSGAKLTLIKVFVTVTILGVLAWQLDLQKSWDLLRGISLLPVVMALGLLAASHMVVALIWRRLLHEVGIPLPVERTVRLYFVGLFLNNFFLGSVGGDTYRVYGVYRESGSGRAALAGTLLERLIGVTALLLLGVVVVVARFGTLPDSLRWFLLLTTGGGALAGLGIVLAPGLVKRVVGPLVRRTSPRMRDRLEGVLAAMSRGGRPGLVVSLLMVALAAQGVRIWTHWWCATALGIGMDPGDLFVVIPLVAVAAGLPISIGGLGVREGSGVLLLAPFGIGETEAFAIELLAYLVGVGTSLVGGFAFLLGREVRPSEVEPIEEEIGELNRHRAYQGQQ